MNFRFLGLTAAALLGSAALAQHTITYSRIVDLSHVISPDIPLWPGDPPVEMETVASFDSDGYHLRRFSIGEHSATHMNAPNSFHEGGVGIDAYMPESLVLPAVVIDVREQSAADADYQLSIDDILEWESLHGRIADGTLVIMFTGWQDKWSDPLAFFNEDADGGMHFPGFSPAATEFLLEERGVAGAGIDTHGVDPGQDDTYATNTSVLARQGIILENLTNLHGLPPTGTTVVIGVLRLQAGSGSPVSVLAFVP